MFLGLVWKSHPFMGPDVGCAGSPLCPSHCSGHPLLSIAAAVEISAWSCHVTFFLAIEMHVGKEVVNSVAVLSVLSTAARSRQDFWASSAKKFSRWRKKLGRKPATPQIIRKSAEKNFCFKFLGQFLPIIVKKAAIRKFGVGPLSRPLTS